MINGTASNPNRYAMKALVVYGILWIQSFDLTKWYRFDLFATQAIVDKNIYLTMLSDYLFCTMPNFGVSGNYT